MDRDPKAEIGDPSRIVPIAFRELEDSAPRSPELQDVLSTTDDPAERERITNNFYQLANGLPNSMIVHFALFSKSLLQEIALRQKDLLNAAPKIEADAGRVANAIAQQTVFPDVDKIKAIIDGNAQTAQNITNAASNIEHRLSAFRSHHQLIAIFVALLYFIGITVAAVWFVANDHRAVQRTINEKVAVGTKDALDRLNAHSNLIQDLVNFGIGAQSRVNNDGNILLEFRGRPGVAELFDPSFKDGALTVTVKH
jgi:hypothetical protein